MRQLDGEVAGGEAARPATGGVERRVAVAGQQVSRHLAVAAAGEAEEMAARLVEGGLDLPALEDGELLLAGQVPAAYETREGGVAVDVSRQQDEVVARHRSGVELTGPAAARPLAAQRLVQLAPAVGQAQLVVGARDGDLEADDGTHRREPRRAGGIGLGLLRRLPAAHRGVEAGVVGDGQRRHAELRGASDQLLGMRRTIEEAEVRVRVELAVVVRRGHRTTNDRTFVLSVPAGRRSRSVRITRWRRGAGEVAGWPGTRRE